MSYFTSSIFFFLICAFLKPNCTIIWFAAFYDLHLALSFLLSAAHQMRKALFYSIVSMYLRVVLSPVWCVAHMTTVVSHHKPGENSLTDKYYNHSMIITRSEHSIIWKKQAVCCQWFQACYSCWGSSEKQALLCLSWSIDGAVERMHSVSAWHINTVQVVWIWLHLKALWICHSLCSYKDFFVLFVPRWKGHR